VSIGDSYQATPEGGKPGHDLDQGDDRHRGGLVRDRRDSR
jgi:hypothetical protein